MIGKHSTADLVQLVQCCSFARLWGVLEGPHCCYVFDKFSVTSVQYVILLAIILLLYQ